jgi:hypothetical protein
LAEDVFARDFVAEDREPAELLFAGLRDAIFFGLGGAITSTPYGFSDVSDAEADGVTALTG